VSTNQPRQPRGVPTGGQWRATARPEGPSLVAPDAALAAVPDAATQPLPRWSASSDLGPIQAKRVKQALANIVTEGKTVVELTGVVGGETREWVMVGVFSSPRPEAVEAQRRLGERFNWTVTPANYRDVEAAAAEAVAQLKATRRVIDKRITPEQDRERRAAQEQREREQRERAERAAALMAEVRAKAPAGAEAVVVAELQEDTSDPMTDYFANKTLRRVAIGYRFGKREDFAQLRQVAASFPETAHLAAKATERRDNWSMGAGNYLSDHGNANAGSGWIVRSYPLQGAGAPGLTEVAIADERAAPSRLGVSGPVTVRPSSTGREGYVEVVFSDRPEPETLNALKAHGFRWARTNKCWYGRDVAFANALATKAG